MNGSDRELSHMSDGALRKATQSANNALGSATYARNMMGNGVEAKDRTGAVGGVEEAIYALEQTLFEINHEWEQRTQGTDNEREQE